MLFRKMNRFVPKSEIRNPKFKRGGFSLVEVLLTVFLVAIFVLSVAAMTPVSNKLRIKADRYAKATNAAQAMMERIRTLEYSQLTLTQLQGLGLVEGNPSVNEQYRFVVPFNQVRLSGSTSMPLSSYLNGCTGQLEVIDLLDSNSRPIDLKSVFVTIRWTEPNAESRQVRLSTIIPRLR